MLFEMEQGGSWIAIAALGDANFTDDNRKSEAYSDAIPLNERGRRVLQQHNASLGLSTLKKRKIIVNHRL